jgi:hypothetical protein
MKRQLSTLQRLIGVMDPELYAHLGMSSSYSTKDSPFPLHVFLHALAIPSDSDEQLATEY